MNFNTTSQTFRQLMGNGLSYRVPRFQRDYSWDVDHWDDLWLDIVGLFGDEPDPAHYMGYSIEHVLPESPGDDWQQFDEQQREASTYRLGNMTLLDSNPNRRLGNTGFTERRRAYLESEFAITRKLAEEFDAWTVDKIGSRQGWMAKQASSIWQVNF